MRASAWFQLHEWIWTIYIHAQQYHFAMNFRWRRHKAHKSCTGMPWNVRLLGACHNSMWIFIFTLHLTICQSLGAFQLDVYYSMKQKWVREKMKKGNKSIFSPKKNELRNQIGLISSSLEATNLIHLSLNALVNNCVEMIRWHIDIHTVNPSTKTTTLPCLNDSKQAIFGKTYTHNRIVLVKMIRYFLRQLIGYNDKSQFPRNLA